jgi:hypothetical protein
MSTIVSALFRAPAGAEAAIVSLLKSGVRRDQITFIARNPLAESIENPAPEPETAGSSSQSGSAAAALLGSEIGGITGLSAGALTVLLPGFGNVWISGAALTGLAVGAGAGALAGGLLAQLGAGNVTPAVAGVFPGEARRGNSLLLVRVADETVAQTARTAIAAAGAERVEIEPGQADPAAAAPGGERERRAAAQASRSHPGRAADEESGSDVETGATPFLDQQLDGKPRGA